MVSTVYKSLTITFLAVSIFISGLSADLVSAQSLAPEPMVTLTPEEQAWLAEHPEIVLGAPTSYPPMVIKRADGTHVGMLVDFFEQVNRRLNTRIRLHIEDSWADIQKKAQNGEIDGLAFGGRDPSRDAIYNTTDIVLPTYFSVFARSQNEYQLKGFSDLEGMRIGYKRAARPTRSLLEKLPATILKPYDDHASMTQALLSKEIDVIVAWMGYDHWRKKRLQGTIDNIFLIKEHPIEMVTHIRNDWPELIPILNKALATLQQDEIPRIINKWFGQWPREPIATRTPLTPKERAWLNAHPEITLGTSASYPPHVVTNPDGTYTGVLPDLYEQISQVLNTRISLEIGKVWVDVQKKAQNRELDGLAIGGRDPNRDALYNPTDTVYPSYFSVFGQSKNNFKLKSFSDLDGLRIGYKRGARPAKTRLEKLPAAILKPYDDHASMTQALLSKEIDVIFAWISYDHWRKTTLQGTIDKILMVDEYPLEMVIYVRKDWPELIPILNKALAALRQEELPRIINKWFGEWPQIHQQEEGLHIALTDEEKVWLAAHSDIRFGFSDDFEPYLIKGHGGKHKGILVDFLNELNAILGTQFGTAVDSWPKLFEKAKNKELAGMLAIAGVTADANGLLKTATTLTVYPTFFIRDGAPFTLNSLNDLRGRSVAILRSAGVMEKILEPYSGDVSISKFSTNLEVMKALFEGKVDIAFGLTLHNYLIIKYAMSGIKPAYTLLDKPFEVVMGVRPDLPELVTILNKGIASFSPQELDALVAKWIDLPQHKNRIELTYAEQAWIDQNRAVRVRITDWPPYQILKGNEPPSGIVIEYLKLIEERTGITFKNEMTDQPFVEFIESMKQRQGPDMTAVIVPTPEREQYLSFSQTYITSPYVIFIREQDKPILDISGLTGKTLAVPRGFVVHERLVEDYPEIRLMLLDSDEAALQSVATGQSDAYIGNLTVASHIIHRRGFSGLQVAASGPFKDQSLSMGNRNDWPELTSIINKALESITEEEKTAIRKKYLAIKYQQGIDKAEVLKWVLMVAVVAFGVVLVFMFWNKQLSRKIKERTSELSESEARFRATFEQVAVGVAHLSLEGEFLRINKKFCDIVGYSEDEILNLTFQDITYPDDLETDLEFVGQVLQGHIENYTMENRYICKGGSIVWVSLTVSLVSDEDGNPEYFVSVIEDISERKRVEAKLTKSEEKYRGLVDNAVIGVFVSTPDGRFTFVNDAMAQMYDFNSPEQMMAEGSLKRWRNLKDRDRMITELQQHSRVTNFEAKTITHTDQPINVLFSAKQIGNGIFGMVMDISERKQAEKKIIDYQQRLKALASQLTITEENARRAIATDLHDNVSQALALARLQLASARKLASEPKLADKLGDISTTLFGALGEIQKLMLELSSPSMHELGISSAISEWLEEQIEKRYDLKSEVIDNISLNRLKDMDSNVRAILFRNIRELVVNVIKHARAKKIIVRLEDRGTDIRIIVEDDGIGFNPHAEPAWRKIGGFGLFSIEELMFDLGGNLKIVSIPGKGCTAILSVPFSVDDYKERD